ncbi:MAG: hypothetical protein E3K36_07180 [Candidatus Brocadia sp.]|nr:hypothetical protein [Candidatus Brocadia sp.]
MNQRLVLGKSRFNEFLIRYNDLHKSGFEEWIFYPGMLFHDPCKWWEDGGVRYKPHEGLDFCFYRDKAGQNHSLDEKTVIPVMYAGEIIHIDDDFLGKSIYVTHDICDDRGNRLYVIYGHTNPFHGIGTGKTLNEGDTIATIADTGKKRAKIPSHLHISMVWLPESFPYEKLDWETLGDCSTVTFCNPLEFIDCKYKCRGISNLYKK